MAPRSVYPVAKSKRLVTWGWTLGGSLCGIALVCVFFAPARWLTEFIAESSANRFQLIAPIGTIWTGSAQLKLAAGKGSLEHTVLPGRVFWKFRPSLRGLSLALHAECCIQQDWAWLIYPTLQGLRVDLSDLPESQPSIWPSALLAGLGTPWNTLQLQGTLLISTRQLSLYWSHEGWHMAGHAQLDASNMTTSLSTLKPVGSYRLALHGGPHPFLQLSTLKGSLQLHGSGRWVNKQLQFEGEASAQADRADALANLLNIIGRRDGARVIIKIG